MDQKGDESAYRELASNYDAQVKAYSSYGHEALFGMCFEFVRANQCLLDIGIGTGLASIHFAQLGLKVYGLDNSQEMLAACRSKSFTEDLKQFDITQDPIPYDSHFFDHAVCCGVLHFADDLVPLFAEVKRVLKQGAVFAFTIAPQDTSANYVEEPTAWGVSIFKHSPRYIAELLAANEMEMLKEQRLLIKGADKVNFDMLFSAIITRYA